MPAEYRLADSPEGLKRCSRPGPRSSLAEEALGHLWAWYGCHASKVLVKVFEVLSALSVHSKGSLGRSSRDSEP